MENKYYQFNIKLSYQKDGELIDALKKSEIGKTNLIRMGLQRILFNADNASNKGTNVAENILSANLSKEPRPVENKLQNTKKDNQLLLGGFKGIDDSIIEDK